MPALHKVKQMKHTPAPIKFCLDLQAQARLLLKWVWLLENSTQYLHFSFRSYRFLQFILKIKDMQISKCPIRNAFHVIYLYSTDKLILKVIWTFINIVFWGFLFTHWRKRGARFVILEVIVFCLDTSTLPAIVFCFSGPTAQL